MSSGPWKRSRRVARAGRSSVGGSSLGSAADAGERRAAPTATGATSVVLVGFMGAGKSHVGTLLARHLGVPFVDTDKLIEAEVGPIEAFFAERGEPAFREVERRVVLAALASLQREPSVLSLGGGAVTDADVCAALRACPHVTWLSAPVDVLWSRVRRAAERGGGRRPLARDEAEFRTLYEQRARLYGEVATVEVRNDGARSAAEVAEVVASALQEAAD